MITWLVKNNFLWNLFQDPCKTSRSIFKSFLFLFLLNTTCFSLDGQDAERFVEAGEQYKQGHYQEAYRMYQEISKPTPRVYFNLGNCAFKLNQNGRALWHWKQAEERWGLFDREDLDNNITLIREKLTVSMEKKAKKPLPILFNKMQSCVHGFPLLALQFIFLILWTLLFVYAKKLLKRKRRSLVALLGVCVFISGGLLLYRHIHATRLRGIVIESKAILYSGPSTTYQQIGFLPEGLTVNIERQRQDFYKIRTKGQFGWVAHKDLGIV